MAKLYRLIGVWLSSQMFMGIRRSAKVLQMRINQGTLLQDLPLDLT
jgi:hypothetical protein